MKDKIFVLLICVPFFVCGQISKNMELCSKWDPAGLEYSDIWGWAAPNGDEYAIIGSLDSIHFIDISDPYNPIQRDAVKGGNTSIWRDFKTYDHYAYCVADQGNSTEGLIIIDLSYLPDSVHLVNQTTAFFNRSHNIFIDEDAARLYAVGNVGSNLKILDLSVDPEDPPLLNSFSLPGQYIHDIYVVNDTAYASHGNRGLYIYDITNPSTANFIASFDGYAEDGYNHSSWRSSDGNFLVFCDETFNRSVKIIDIREYENIELLDLFKSTLLAPTATNSIAHNPFIKGDHVFISYYHDGVQVYDISDPEDVVKVAYYDTYATNTSYAGYAGAWGTYPFLPSGHIITSDDTYGLAVTKLACGKEAITKNNDGFASLRAAIDCANSGDTVRLSEDLIGDTIRLTQSIIIDKDLVIMGEVGTHVMMEGGNVVFEIFEGNHVGMEGFSIIAGTATDGRAIINHGILTLGNMNVFDHDPPIANDKLILNHGDLIINRAVRLERQ